jgi:hypothetical protein
MKKTTVLFVHGFGVKGDARGMFTEIAEHLGSAHVECILMDLNGTDDKGNILVNPFSMQVALLQEVRGRYKDTKVILIAHSQGCLVSAMADLSDISTSIFLAPSVSSSPDLMIAHFGKNHDTVINREGMSEIARSDGTTTMVPAKYWLERDQVDVRDIYEIYQKERDVIVVIAGEDEVVDNKHTNSIFNYSGKTPLKTDHYFTGAGRNQLFDICMRYV